MSSNRRVDFEALKARADFRTVLAHYRLDLTGRGGQAKLLCPFHDERRPSCSVNLTKGVFHCFGCGAKGNVLDFVHRMEGQGGTVSIREAGIRLAEICGIVVDGGDAPERPQEARGATKGRRTRKASSRGRERAQEASEGLTGGAEEPARPARNKPLGFTLALDPEHPYLAGRVPATMIAPFGLGYCGRGIMRGRACIPIHNAQGELVAYAGRWAGPPEAMPEGEDRYKLPPEFHKRLELFNLHRVKRCRHLVVVEGFFSAIHLHAARIPAVALMGRSIAEEQIALLREQCPELSHVTVLLDGDEPGRRGAEAAVPRLARHWWTRDVALPENEKPDTIGLEALHALLRSVGQGRG